MLLWRKGKLFIDVIKDVDDNLLVKLINLGELVSASCGLHERA
jgi:hypothetical protein